MVVLQVEVPGHEFQSGVMDGERIEEGTGQGSPKCDSCQTFESYNIGFSMGKGRANAEQVAKPEQALRLWRNSLQTPLHPIWERHWEIGSSRAQMSCRMHEANTETYVGTLYLSLERKGQLPCFLAPISWCLSRRSCQFAPHLRSPWAASSLLFSTSQLVNREKQSW